MPFAFGVGFGCRRLRRPMGLWDEWPGMDVRTGSSFNMQFTRQPRP
jgi:hypothetical protein